MNGLNLKLTTHIVPWYYVKPLVDDILDVDIMLMFYSYAAGG